MAKPTGTPLTLRTIEGDQEDLAAALDLRWRVFVEEQRVPPGVERDDLDAGAVHVLASAAGPIHVPASAIEIDDTTGINVSNGTNGTNETDEKGKMTVGVGRLVRDGAEGRISRIAVLPEWRRRGVASQIIAALEAEAARMGLTHVSLHAQTYVRKLYEKRGYEVSGPPFIEAGIDHVPMRKKL
jgi:predicted GNAT family N-acyltransferase